MDGISMLSGSQGHGASVSNVNVHLINPGIIDSNAFFSSKGKNIIGYASQGTSSCPVNNSGFQEQSASPASLSGILAARIGHQENLEKSQVLSPLFGSLDSLGPYMLENWSYAPSHLPLTHGYNNNMPNGNLDSNGWASSSNVTILSSLAYGSSNFCNEPVLSLATSPTTVQFSEVSCSDQVTRCFSKTRSGLELGSCSNREPAMSLNNSAGRHFHSSQTMLGSRYLTGIQEILAQLARFSLENLEQVRYSQSSSMFNLNMEAPLPIHAAESNKSELLTLLELVDSRYNQCLDEIHTVVSAFHAATELDPRVHVHFALQTIFLLYKNLRNRISNYILAMGPPDLDSSCAVDKEGSIDPLLIHKQLSLQTLKRKDHQLWRPPRGLPENSVSILRAWMFQNFLHPYPKDSEKHLLALKAGLTRNQVSNWFINARVRLWKPMIEEMYAELNRKRKASRNEGEAESSSHGRLGR
ncbi:hypothetical protein QN277_017784 [Acacia crassicarpa]|nr:hypothetical protein QN277_017784 [Acacia crassicarpa]